MDVQPGQIVVFRGLDSYGIARVEQVKERICTSRAWDGGNRRWAGTQKRIKRSQLEAVLPDGADVAELADRFTSLANRYDFERRQARADFHFNTRKLLKEGDA